MRSLLWKEWHEQRWKLAFGSLILAAFALVGLRARVIADATMLEAVCLIAVPLLSVLSSTGLVPAERDEGTLETLLALPVHPAIIFAVKSLVGVLLCTVPIILAAAVGVAVAGGREISAAAIVGLHLRTLAATLSLYFWMLALTVRLPTETRAALVTMGVLMMWMIVTLGLTQSWTPQMLPSPFWLLDPLVFLLGFKDGKWAVSLGLAAPVQSVIAAALWLGAAWQFPRPVEARS
jgi:ABC-type transport system involved in multi-copper enzyme maturation permease subunit